MCLVHTERLTVRTEAAHTGGDSYTDCCAARQQAGSPITRQGARSTEIASSLLRNGCIQYPLISTDNSRCTCKHGLHPHQQAMLIRELEKLINLQARQTQTQHGVPQNWALMVIYYKLSHARLLVRLATTCPPQCALAPNRNCFDCVSAMTLPAMAALMPTVQS